MIVQLIFLNPEHFLNVSFRQTFYICVLFIDLPWTWQSASKPSGQRYRAARPTHTVVSAADTDGFELFSRNQIRNVFQNIKYLEMFDVQYLHNNILFLGTSHKPLSSNGPFSKHPIRSPKTEVT